MKIKNVNDIPECIPMLADWVYNEFIHNTIPDCSQQDILHAFSTRKNDAIPMSFAAIIDGLPAGTISLFENDLKTMPRIGPWIAAVYVVPAYRGRGIASELVAHACEQAGRLGYTELYLRTENAQGLYEKLGWQKVCDTHDELCRDVSVYRKDL